MGIFVCPGAEPRDGAGGTSGIGLKEGRGGEWAPRSFFCGMEAEKKDKDSKVGKVKKKKDPILPPKKEDGGGGGA